MKKIEVISGNRIETALESSKRQYLAGELALPQELDYLRDPHIEAGITEYKEYTIEKPHYHTTTTEYIYVLAGESKYIDIKTKEETLVEKGDFFLIRPGITYAQKSKAGLKLLFFKYPSGNDKVSVEEDGSLNAWYTNW
ncbi:Hypothetical protein LUCI_2526 [Lucifera butyrica]|uniref:Cupin type-2 domain-containing protein n=1 Tax=Lucifera butyrica TaxID=1351585 RepID=A0A498RAG8_9FIRM|nr:cupin domain-containing protein [Lucifera butyrica]VBB07282.1 Hypothetical protein LUCI_2526 [Lucifera butyrica]